MARHITTAVTLLILCSLLVLGAVTGWKYLFAELPGDGTAAETPGPTCTTKQVDAGQRLRSRQVRVSVFNGGTRAGLANETLDALRRRGFKLGAVGNAPSDINVKRVQVWSLEEDDAEARLVAGQFGKKIKIVFSDVDLGPGVDVIVGNSFNGLRRNAKTSIEVKSTQEVCVPVPSAEASPSPNTNARGR